MKKSRYSAEQVAFALRQAESGTLVPEVCRKMGIAEQTFYRWKRMYGGLGVPEIKRIKQLEEENRKLKQMVGEQAMVIQAQKEVMKKRVGLRVTVKSSRCSWNTGCGSGERVGMWEYVEGRFVTSSARRTRSTC